VPGALRAQPPIAFVVVGAACLVLGFVVAHNPLVAFALGLCVLLLIGLMVTPAYWVLGAVVAAVVFPGLVSLGLLPGIANYLHFALAFGALAVALATTDTWTRLARSIVLGLFALGMITALSCLLSGSEPVRGLFYFALVGEPLALLAAILLRPPSDQARSVLVWSALALLVVQIPVTLVQTAGIGFGSVVSQTDAVDAVRGTVGVENGAHLVSGIAVVGVFWLLARPARPRWLLVVVGLLAIPFLASAMQVVFALPAVLVIGPIGGMLRTGVRVAVVSASVVLLVATPSLNRGYSIDLINEALGGESGKLVAGKAVGAAVSSDLASAAFGAGPAQTVSSAAYRTTDPLREQESPIRFLHLEPSRTALDLGALDDVSGSFDRPLSSALGVLGDLGVIGAITYVGLWLLVLIRLRRLRTPEAIGACAGVALFLVLGLISAWWEEASFMLYVSLLAGLALSRGNVPNEKTVHL
jgi:hypothetical protein